MATGELTYLGPLPGPRVPVAATNAVSQTETREWFGEGTPWRQWSRLSGDWGELRTALEDHGFSPGATYLLDASDVFNGGVRRRGIVRGLLDLNLTFDPKPTTGIEGGTFFAQYYFRHGPDGSADAGVLQPYDNMDAGPLSRAEEVWYEQKLLDGRLRVKAGQVDANAEFDFISPGDFIHSSFGHSPTAFSMPTYPDPALSVNAFVYPTEWVYGGAGIYWGNFRHLAGSFDDPYLIGEVGVTYPGVQRFGPGRVAIGGWHDTHSFDRFDGSSQKGASGFFALAEQQIWNELPDTSGDHQGISAFIQYGYADPDVSAFEHHFGVGLNSAGPIPGRDDDTAGVYWSWVRTSRASGAGFDRNESALEFYYRLAITPFFTVQPDLQWIWNPGGHTSPDSAFVGTIRASFIF